MWTVLKGHAFRSADGGTQVIAALATEEMRPQGLKAGLSAAPVGVTKATPF